MTGAILQLTVQPQRAPLVGRVPIFDDAAIVLSRIALGAVCRGRTRIDLLQAPGAAESVLLRALELLGVPSEVRRAADGTHELEIAGQGLTSALREPGVLDVRGACDVAGLLVGLLAGRPGAYDLLVDERVAEAVGTFLVPLGALVVERDASGCMLRLRWSEAARLPGFELESSGHFPWLKHAALLAGLRASGETTIFENVASADHLERALARARAPLVRAGSLITLHPPRDPDAFAPDRFAPIGSAHGLAYLAAAALMIPGSRIEVHGVSTNPSGPDVAGLVRVLGGGASVRPGGDLQGEPVGDVTFFGRLGHASGRTSVVAGEGAIRLGDALLPVLVASVSGVGRFEFPDIVSHARGGDPRVVERAVGYLRNAGATVTLEPTALGHGVAVVGQGDQATKALRVTTGGDGRLAAVGTLMAMASQEPSVIDDVDCLRAEFPRWIGTLKALGASVETRPA